MEDFEVCVKWKYLRIYRVEMVTTWTSPVLWKRGREGCESVDFYSFLIGVTHNSALTFTGESHGQVWVERAGRDILLREGRS